jgi:hypothetical protein
MIDTICNLSGCFTDWSRATEADYYYIWATSLEVIIATALAGLFTLKMMLKYRKYFRYD